MPIIGLGTDLARVARFREFVAAEKTALLERLFTPGERQYAFAKADPSQPFLCTTDEFHYHHWHLCY